MIKNSTGAITVYVDSDQSLTWATALDSSNKGGLIKDGEGTLTLGAVPQYSGSTVVQNGELVVQVRGTVWYAELKRTAPRLLLPKVLAFLGVDPAHAAVRAIRVVPAR